MKFRTVFDDVILKQLKRLGEKEEIREILTNMLNKIEELGPRAGELIDSKLFIYEIKNKRPPIRLYFKHVKDSCDIYVFEFELKTSEKKQKKTIDKLKDKTRNLFRSLSLFL